MVLARYPGLSLFCTLRLQYPWIALHVLILPFPFVALIHSICPLLILRVLLGYLVVILIFVCMGFQSATLSLSSTSSCSPLDIYLRLK